ncbi:MAG: alpha/beta fold hydrolase [Lachnospiraceae bacterium]|nr:alpha/beta fold hydrolase [Lachnospiraceae bacterium]
MIEKETFKLKSSNQTNDLYVMLWKDNEKKPKGIVQISHGMIEHIGRYGETAEYLAEHGYVVIGHDHLGHGKTAADEAEWGYFPGGNPGHILVEDLHRVTLMAKEKFPGLPLFLLGHSMGSLISRRYLMTYGGELAGLLILGTGRMGRITLFFGNLLIKLLILLKGEKHHSMLTELIIFGAYNNRFSDNRFGKEWLTKDQEKLKEYVGDKACCFTFSLNGVAMLVEMMKFIQKKKHIQRIPKEVPVIFMAGTEDPFGEFGRGVNQIYETYRKLGLNDICVQMYDNDRHEILNETDRQEVFGDIAGWLDRHC